MRGEIPVMQANLDPHKLSIINGYRQGFGSAGQISGQLSDLVVYGLPDSYFNDYIQKISAVTLQDVNRAAHGTLTHPKWRS